MNAFTNKITPHSNVALSDDEKKLFNEANSFQKDRFMMGQAAIKAGFWVGGIGALIGVCGMVCAATLFPLKTREVEYYTVNQETGYVGPSVGSQDAPALYSARVREAVIQSYIQNRENFLYETDGVAFHTVAIQSTADEQARYKARHDDPKSPARRLGERGYIQVDNFQFFELPVGKFKTFEYVVKFDRKIMVAGQPVPTKGEPCTVQIAFQFHPEYPMLTADRRINVTGLQVLSYRPNNDDPKQRTAE